jgi:AcrR family transcriptional regulator
MARVRNPRGEGERLRDALLDAATDVLNETRDVEKLSVRAVTGRAGVSPTAMYIQFADKDELTDAVKARCFDALGEALARAESAHEGDSVEQLRAMGHAYLRFARDLPGQYAILFQVAKPEVPTGGRRPKREAVGDNVFGRVVDAVARCRKGGNDAFDIACMLWMALHGRATVQRALPSFAFPNETRFIDMLVEYALSAEA